MPVDMSICQVGRIWREVSRERRFHLSAENMWTNAEFVDKYLRPMQCATKWETMIYPAMKDAIVCSMLVAQDTIDSRKVFSDDTTRERTPSTSLSSVQNSFELFGADFMLDEDLKPWLIEINCSPTMARCTTITSAMCDRVLEDTCKGNETAP